MKHLHSLYRPIHLCCPTTHRLHRTWISRKCRTHVAWSCLKLLFHAQDGLKLQPHQLHYRTEQAFILAVSQMNGIHIRVHRIWDFSRVRHWALPGIKPTYLMCFPFLNRAQQNRPEHIIINHSQVPTSKCVNIQLWSPSFCTPWLTEPTGTCANQKENWGGKIKKLATRQA